MNWGGERWCWVGEMPTAPAARVPACAGMTGEERRNDGGGGGDDGVGVGVAGGGRCGRLGRGMTGVARSLLRTPHLASPLKGGRDELGKGRGWWLGRRDARGACRAGSCLRRNDGRGRRNDGGGGRGDGRGRGDDGVGVGVAGGGRCGRLGRGMTGVARSLLRTPHLASPLKGGRDELGKGRGWWLGRRDARGACRAGSCLRRNDGRGRRNDGGGGRDDGVGVADGRGNDGIVNTP